MDSHSFWLIVTVFIPTLGCFLLPLFSSISERARNAFAVLLGAITFLGALNLLPSIWKGSPVSLVLQLPYGLGLHLGADPLAVFMALVSSSVGLIIVIFSLGYISHYPDRTEYYVMVLLFLGSMMGLIFSLNLIWMFVFWEITAICSWRLVGFFRSDRDIVKADKTFLVTVFGALCMLLGFIMVYAKNGTFDLQALRGKSIPELAVLLILVGIFSKSATLPFSTWLPDAGVAPSPVTALLHAAVLVKIGVYAFARIFCATLQMGPTWETLVPAIAAASALISAGAALIDTDLKRIIAYSTISQIGFIFLGLSTQNRIGVAGGMLFILMHGVAKGGLFLCAGIVEQNTKIKDITKMGGLISTMPITAISFAFCALSVMGIPPFGGFFSKFMVFQGAAITRRPWIIATFLLTAALTLAYLFRLFYLIFLGEQRHPSAKEGSLSMVSSVAALGLLSLLLGIFIHFPALFADKVFAQIGAFLP
jgi:NADH:ubiquinone oxidoreductase subunit 5 (subunit L)/multisubunit Na+/H+ antiporter MnhA subunit